MLIIFENHTNETKFVCQAKYNLQISSKEDSEFEKLIKDSWQAFNSKNIEQFSFNPQRDKIVIIIGKYSKTIESNAKGAIEWARSSTDAKNFFQKINKEDYSSKGKRDFINTISEILKSENNYNKELVFDFLKVFEILFMDIEGDTSPYFISCIALLRKKFGHKAQILFDKLYRISSEKSKYGGSFSFNNLSTILQSDYDTLEIIKNDDLFNDYRKTRDYLRYVKDIRTRLDNKYIQSYAIELDTSKYPSKKKENNGLNDKFFSLIDYINNFLKQDTKWYVVLCSKFGIGKTSFIYNFSSMLAEKNLNNEDTYIPIPIFLRNGLENIYNQENLDGVFKIFSNVKSGQISDEKILLLVDGVDEFNGSYNFIKDIKNIYHSQFPNMKVIFTSRITDNLFDYFKNEQYFISLLPLKQEQIREFLNINNIKISMDVLVNSGIKNDLIGNPLFLNILSKTIKKYPDLFDSINSDLSETVQQSLIYHLFLNSIYLGKEKSTFSNRELKKNKHDERRIIRDIALLKSIYKEKLTTHKCKEFIGIEDDAIFEPILFTHFQLELENGNNYIEFLHNSFKEFLLAEYFLESILQDKTYRLNLDSISKETIFFLEGLIKLIILKEEKESKISKSNILDTSMNNFNSIELSNNIKKSFNNKYFHVFKKENEYAEQEKIWLTVNTTYFSYINFWITKWILFYLYEILTQNKNDLDTDVIFDMIKFSSDYVPSFLKKFYNIDFKSYDMSKSDFNNAELKQCTFDQCTIYMSNFNKAKIHNCLFQTINLNVTDFYASEIVGTTLSESSISNAFLNEMLIEKSKIRNTWIIFSDLKEAGFKNSVFDTSRFSDSYFLEASIYQCFMKNCDFIRIDFFYSRIKNTVILNSNFSSSIFYMGPSSDKSKISDTLLIECNFRDVNFRGVHFSNCIFVDCNLDNANLSDALFSNCIFVDCNLDNANLFNAKLHDCLLLSVKYANLNCNNTDFLNSIFQDKNLVEYINQTNSTNVNESIDVVEINNKIDVHKKQTLENLNKFAIEQEIKEELILLVNKIKNIGNL